MLNGDVDNHADLEVAHGLRFAGPITTDAKVIPALLSTHATSCRGGTDLLEAFRRTVAEFEGSVAIGAASATDPGRVLLALKGSGQVVYIGLSVYGWYQWLHGGAQRSALGVSRVTTREVVILAVVGIAGAWLLGELLYRNTDASIPYLDSALVSASLVAQWMMTRKQLECWLVWIAADIVYVGMFIYKALFLTAFLYAVFTVLAVMGYREWRGSLRARGGSVEPAHGR